MAVTRGGGRAARAEVPCLAHTFAVTRPRQSRVLSPRCEAACVWVRHRAPVYPSPHIHVPLPRRPTRSSRRPSGCGSSPHPSCALPKSMSSPHCRTRPLDRRRRPMICHQARAHTLPCVHTVSHARVPLCSLLAGLLGLDTLLLRHNPRRGVCKACAHALAPKR